MAGESRSLPLRANLMTLSLQLLRRAFNALVVKSITFFF